MAKDPRYLSNVINSDSRKLRASQRQHKPLLDGENKYKENSRITLSNVSVKFITRSHWVTGKNKSLRLEVNVNDY